MALNVHAALFTIAKTWKQPKCPSAEGWIKMRHIYTMEYCSAIERNKTVPFAETWIGLETVIQTEVSQKGKNKWSHINAHMWNLEKWYRWTYLQSRNRDIDMENKRLDTKLVGGWQEGWIGRLILTYVHYYACFAKSSLSKENFLIEFWKKWTWMSRKECYHSTSL